jgi:hypothetical protein
LFHDQNSSCGHFEPFFSYKSLDARKYLGHANIEWKCAHWMLNAQVDTLSIEQVLSEQQLFTIATVVGDCHGTLF